MGVQCNQYEWAKTSQEDQNAVSEYFASVAFSERGSQVHPLRQRDLELPPSGVSPGPISLFAGMFGISGMASVFGFVVSFAIYGANEFLPSPPNHYVMMIVTQAMLLPPLVVSAFAIVVPMFWYGSILHRFTLAFLAILPGSASFYFACVFLNFTQPDFAEAFLTVILAAFLAAVVVTLLFQMCFRWTLTHERRKRSPLPRLGIQSLIELTVVSAIGFVLLSFVDFEGYLEGLILVVGITLIVSFAIISNSIASLGENRRSSSIKWIGFVCAFLASFFTNCFFAVIQFGWNVIGIEALSIGGLSVFGALLIHGAMWICFEWLQFCGWRCVNRSRERA